ENRPGPDAHRLAKSLWVGVVRAERGSIVAPRRKGLVWFGNRGLKPTATIGCRSAAETMAGGRLPDIIDQGIRASESAGVLGMVSFDRLSVSEVLCRVTFHNCRHEPTPRWRQ